MKILHLSDLHVGISKHHNEKVEKIIRNIKNQNVDHIVITGDLTNSGSKEEFEMLADMLCRYGLHTENKLTVIPGNHDLYAPFFSRFLSITSVMKNYKQALEFFRFHFSYNKKSYINDLNNFNEYFKRSFTGSYTVEESICGYPFVKTLGDKVALIGIDSNSLPSLLKNPGCSTGEIKKRGLTALKKIFESKLVKDKIKIVLIHHYLHPTDTYIDTGISFRFIKLFNREVLVKLFDDYNVNLVLHGHFHVDNKYWLVDHKIMVLNGGATMNGQWHLINVNGEKITVL